MDNLVNLPEKSLKRFELGKQFFLFELLEFSTDQVY
jgi:hypothetical protein